MSGPVMSLADALQRERADNQRLRHGNQKLIDELDHEAKVISGMSEELSQASQDAAELHAELERHRALVEALVRWDDDLGRSGLNHMLAAHGFGSV